MDLLYQLRRKVRLYNKLHPSSVCHNHGEWKFKLY